MQVCGDVEALPLAANSLDMVWSNLAVQWCNDLPATFVELHRVLKADGLLMFSTFGPDTLKELRQAFNGVDQHNHLNRFADMHDIGDMLVHGGFAEPVMDMEYLTLTYDDVRGVLQDLKAIGAHNATAGRGQGLMGKTAWERLVENYERLRRDGKLPATYEVVYGHAWKPQPRVTTRWRGDHQDFVQIEMNYFVTGTDTNVGKTLISCALLHGFAARGKRVVGMKPVAAGCDDDGQHEDARQLRAASNVPASYEPDQSILFCAGDRTASRRSYGSASA